MSWVNLDAAARRGQAVPIHEGDTVTARTHRGDVVDVTWARSPGGGRAFYDVDGEPVDVLDIEIT